MKIAEMIIFAGIVGSTVGWASVNVPAFLTMSPEEMDRSEKSVYYSGCKAARAAGAAPIYRGQPGYRRGMDGDGDGIAYEPYYGR